MNAHSPSKAGVNNLKGKELIAVYQVVLGVRGYAARREYVVTSVSDLQRAIRQTADEYTVELDEVVVISKTVLSPALPIGA